MWIRINDIQLDENYLSSNGDVLQGGDDGLYFHIHDDGLIIKLDSPGPVAILPDGIDKLIEALTIARDHCSRKRLEKLEKQMLSKWENCFDKV